MVDLARWLGQQLDEDERIAWAACGPDNRWEGSGARDDGPAHTQENRDADHIAAWDPARVLREIDAKRQMLARYEELLAASKEQGLIGDVTEEYQDFLLRLLALPYADRPGYREEWAL